MSFFPEVPEPELPDEPEEWVAPEWLQPSADEYPAEAPLGLTLFASDRIAITMPRVAVYSTGARFKVQWHVRRRNESHAEWDQAQRTIHMHHGMSPGMLRFGIEFADGRRVTTVDAQPSFDRMQRPEQPTLHLDPGGGGGGAGRVTMHGNLWAWPLPPDGPLRVVVEWRDRDVPETAVLVGPISFAELAASARPLWPDDQRPHA